MFSSTAEKMKEFRKVQVPFRISSKQAENKNGVEKEQGMLLSEWKPMDVEACRSLVSSVLLHWQPVRSDGLPKEQNRDGKPDLACKIAYLVFRWLVKSLVDSSFNVQNVLLTFKWFKQSVLSNPTVVEEIIKDEALKSSIFKLFSSVCRASEEKTSYLSDLSLLNAVMLHLLDFQNLTKNRFHGIVTKFCISAMEEDDTMKKGNFSFIKGTERKRL